MSIIDMVEGLCLEDDQTLAEFAHPGAPFVVIFVDMSTELGADRYQTIAKYISGRDIDMDGNELFLQCEGDRREFARMCRSRVRKSGKRDKRARMEGQRDQFVMSGPLGMKDWRERPERFSH
jgi:hypothetical protein